LPGAEARFSEKAVNKGATHLARRASDENAIRWTHAAIEASAASVVQPPGDVVLPCKGVAQRVAIVYFEFCEQHLEQPMFLPTLAHRYQIDLRLLIDVTIAICSYPLQDHTMNRTRKEHYE
jgi:hypothetical protein